MKYAVAAIWLLASLLSRNTPVPRTFFAYAGSILAFMHIGAATIGLWGASIDRRSVEHGAPIGGYLVGVVLGLVAGILLGGVVSRNPIAYFIVQVILAGFLAIMPLVRI